MLQTHVIPVLIAFLGGGGVWRFIAYVAKQMPPLPPNSGWWTQLVYGLVKGASGLDPSKVTPTNT